VLENVSKIVALSKNFTSTCEALKAVIYARYDLYPLTSDPSLPH